MSGTGYFEIIDPSCRAIVGCWEICREYQIKRTRQTRRNPRMIAKTVFISVGNIAPFASKMKVNSMDTCS
jgi:hypothetical protein